MITQKPPMRMRKHILSSFSLLLASLGAIGATYTDQPILKGAELRFAVSTNASLKTLKSAEFASVWRNGFYAEDDGPRVIYRSINAACSLNGGNGDDGSQVKLADGNCAVASFPPEGVDIRIFGAQGATDPAVPIRAAIAASIAQKLPVLFRPRGAVYELKSVDPLAFNPSNNGNSAYPNTVQPGLYFGTTGGAVVHGLTVDWGGVTLRMSGAGCTGLPKGYNNKCDLAGPVFFDNIRNLKTVGSLTIQDSNRGPQGPVTEIGQVGLFNLVDFNIGPMSFFDTGGAGVPIYGNWLVNGKVHDIYAPQAGAALADMAFLKEVVFDHWYGRAADTSGRLSAQGTGISIIYDVPNAAQNKTGVPFTSTENFTLQNSDLGGFNVCFSPQEGTTIKSIRNRYTGCTGSGKQTGYGIGVHNNDNIASGGVHPSGVISSQDTFVGNGNPTAGGGDFGVLWNPAIPTGDLNKISVLGGTFRNYVGSPAHQIDAQTPHHANLTVRGSKGLRRRGVIAGPPSSGVDRIDVPQP